MYWPHAPLAFSILTPIWKLTIIHTKCISVLGNHYTYNLSVFCFHVLRFLLFSVKNILSHLLLCITNSSLTSCISQKAFPNHPNLNLMPLPQGFTASCGLINMLFIYNKLLTRIVSYVRAEAIPNSFTISVSSRLYYKCLKTSWCLMNICGIYK